MTYNVQHFYFILNLGEVKSDIIEDSPSHTNDKLDASDELPTWKTIQRPVAYVQQIIMKSMVHPYKKDDLVRTDAFRGPLASAFKLHLEDLTVYQDLKR